MTAAKSKKSAPLGDSKNWRRVKALDQTWRDHHDELLGFVRRRVRHADLAEDILQDVFTKAHSRLSTLADADRIQSWLYQIARNTIIDYYRTRRNAEPLAERRVQLPEQGDEPGQGLDRCVLPMMKLLPEMYRDALVLSEIEGLPLKEVAERLKLSLPGTKSRIQRGRERLKGVFLECCQFRFDGRGKPVDWSPRDGCNRIPC